LLKKESLELDDVALGAADVALDEDLDVVEAPNGVPETVVVEVTFATEVTVVEAAFVVADVV